MKKAFCLVLAALALTGLADVKKVAVFVQNRTNMPAIDDEIDGIRDRLAASLAGIEGISVFDSAQIADTFRRYKVTTDEERKGLVSGVFTGGSVPNISKMIGCDYIIAASVIGATSLKRNLGGRLNTVYTLRITTKVMDNTGATAGALIKPNWSGTFPVVDDTGDDPLNYYNILIDRWVDDATNQIAAKAPTWRTPSAEATTLVSFDVKTSIDSSVAELESQTKGAKGEDLVQLRKVVGAATVELDGAVIGSTPNSFKASPGLHQIKITREWMKPYTATVNIQEGMLLNVALEMSEEGIAKWGSEEALRADLARRYSEAAALRGIKVNIDSSNWRDVGTIPNKVLIEK